MSLQQTTSKASHALLRNYLKLGIVFPALLTSGLLFAVSARAQSAGDYTHAQAQMGAQVFSDNCSQCHGSQLQGKTGPALAGSSFASSLEYSKMSASQLFQFISSQMPYNDPGSLKEQQYLDVLAYILSQNGYPPGDTSLSKSSLNQVKLLPYPNSSKSQQN